MSRKFIVIGAGGIGSRLCRDLAMMLEYKEPNSTLVIVDGDNFEPKNKERQLFSQMGNKAEVVAGDIMPLVPSTFVAPIPKWIVAQLPDNVAEQEEEGEHDKWVQASALFDEGDVIFCVVDNFAARKVVFDAAREFTNIDVFTAGNDDKLFVSAYHYRRRDGVDITDHPESWHPELIDPPDRNPAELSCQERAALDGGTQLLATNTLAAAWLVGRTQYTIFEGNDPGSATETFLDVGVGIGTSFDRTADGAAVSTTG